MKYIFIIYVLFYLLLSSIYGQTIDERIDKAEYKINSPLQSYDNGSFQLIAIADIDSEFINTFITLKDCFVFVACSKDQWESNERFINGIYKENQLLWLSDQILSHASQAYIIDIMD